MYLVDTDIISVLRRPERHPQVARWFDDRNPDDLYVSVITIGEIQRGIAQERHRDVAFAGILDRWLRGILATYDGRILIVDLATARRWGELTVEIGNRDPDLLMAATALERDLTVVTRNVRHFEPTGVRIANPFEA